MNIVTTTGGIAESLIGNTLVIDFDHIEDDTGYALEVIDILVSDIDVWDANIISLVKTIFDAIIENKK